MLFIVWWNAAPYDNSNTKIPINQQRLQFLLTFVVLNSVMALKYRNVILPNGKLLRIAYFQSFTIWIILAGRSNSYDAY